MPVRTLVKTDEERLIALTIAKMNNDGLSETYLVLRPETVIRLNNLQPLFAEKMHKRNSALAQQSLSTAQLNELRARLRMYISHFIQVFNLGIQRGVYRATDRPLFNIDFTSEKLPYLKNDSSLLSYGADIIAGDAVRVAAGGAPMLNPTTAELEAVFNDFNACRIAHSHLKYAYDISQEAVAALRKSADSLILRIWNEVETYFSEDEISSKRRKASLWGVKYKSLPGENVQATD